MKKKRRKFSAEFKLKVILEALRERQSLSELSARFELHPNQISKWKNDFWDNTKEHLKSSVTQGDSISEKEFDKLYAKVGRLQTGNDFLKKGCSNG